MTMVVAVRESSYLPRCTSDVVHFVCIVFCIVAIAGCGTTKSYTATDQLLMSDAVDATVAKLDFSPLASQKVYLDVTYLKTVRSPLLIESDYVISALRQQLVSAGVLLVESREQADIVAEARLGALGLDGHSVTYGVPSNQALSAASTALGTSMPLPLLPEVALARREAKSGAAKIAVFAYDRVTREPYWQSGIAQADSESKDTWILGMGPFQRGTIYESPRFAGSDISSALVDSKGSIRETPQYAQYAAPRLYTADEKTELASKDSAAESSNPVKPAAAEEPKSKK